MVCISTCFFTLLTASDLASCVVFCSVLFYYHMFHECSLVLVGCHQLPTGWIRVVSGFDPEKSSVFFFL